uniref:Group-specific protein n=1 Tax=Heterorhabditis bacteriophora TaxID=37862 RepID=A0A1I7W6B9_HETBA
MKVRLSLIRILGFALFSCLVRILFSKRFKNTVARRRSVAKYPLNEDRFVCGTFIHYLLFILIFTQLIFQVDRMDSVLLLPIILLILFCLHFLFGYNKYSVPRTCLAYNLLPLNPSFYFFIPNYRFLPQRLRSALYVTRLKQYFVNIFTSSDYIIQEKWKKKHR